MGFFCIWNDFICFIVDDNYHHHHMTNHVYKGKNTHQINICNILTWVLFCFTFIFYFFVIPKKSSQAIYRTCLTIMEWRNLLLNVIQEINVRCFFLASSMSICGIPYDNHIFDLPVIPSSAFNIDLHYIKWINKILEILVSKCFWDIFTVTNFTDTKVYRSSQFAKFVYSMNVNNIYTYKWRLLGKKSLYQSTCLNLLYSNTCERMSVSYNWIIPYK